MKVIFLDIDGVLNGYNKTTDKIDKLFTKLNLLILSEFFFSLNNIHLLKMIYLKLILVFTNTQIVLISSIRHKVLDPKCTLKSCVKFRKYSQLLRIPIYGCIDDFVGEREADIEYWLDDHPEVEDFIIIDDEIAFYEKYRNKVIQTSKKDKICGHADEDTGLKAKHVFRAIKKITK